MAVVALQAGVPAHALHDTGAVVGHLQLSVGAGDEATAARAAWRAGEAPEERGGPYR